MSLLTFGISVMRTGLGAVALLLGMPSLTVLAADLGSSEPVAITDPTHPFFTQRWLVQAGAAFNHVDSSANVGRAGGAAGTNLDLEDDLGLSTQKTSFDGMLRMRMDERWNMEFGYSDLSRSGTTSASRTIEFGRLEFPANASLSTDLGIAVYRLAFGYALYRSKETEAGVEAGLYIHDFNLAASGQANVGGLAAGFQSETFGVVVPLPTIGLFAHHAITPKWLISGRVDYMDLSLNQFHLFGFNLDDVSARVLSLEASTEYRITDNFALGVAYRYQDAGFGATTGRLRGHIAYTTSAPIAFVRAGF